MTVQNSGFSKRAVQRKRSLGCAEEHEKMSYPKEATKNIVVSKTNLNKICKYWFLDLTWSIYRDRQEIKVIIYLPFAWDCIKIVWPDLTCDAVNGQNSTVIHRLWIKPPSIIQPIFLKSQRMPAPIKICFGLSCYAQPV